MAEGCKFPGFDIDLWFLARRNVNIGSGRYRIDKCFRLMIRDLGRPEALIDSR
jgi:hypothetical protein